MLHFTVDDQQVTNGGCVKCCCEKLSLKPGTISKVSVGYAPWAVPIGQLHCPPQFVIEPLQTCPVPVGGNLPPQPQADLVRFDTPVNVHLDGDLNIQVSDPETDPLTFKLLPLYGPKHGKLVLDPAGLFAYDPVFNYQGEDRFFCSVSDGVNPPVVFEAVIAVGIASATLSPTPHVSIDHDGVTVDQRYFTVSFPVKVSPAAQLCEVWRLTVLQGALDCDCTCYQRTDCFDIGIVKC
ncbi:Ig-like domain-containing protein [Bradyrhizobium sp. USDA 10063]